MRLFFALPESDGFNLAGGAGLIAAGASSRPTEDLDLFTSAPSVTAAADAFEAAATSEGWEIERVHDTDSFRRIVVSTAEDEQVLVDVARDAGPLSAAVVTDVGPVYPLIELAGRKMLALFDRAALRDFVDVGNLARRYETEALLAIAAEIDEGFDVAVFARMLETLDRFSDDEITALSDADGFRRFFADWARELSEQSE